MATNPINPMQLFKIISKQQNPQQFMCNMLQERMGDNPVMIKTGIKVLMPDDEYLMLVNRSSNPKKKKLVIPNSVGIVDADYYGNPDNDGEMMFAFYNLSNEIVVIEAGEKLGQGIFCKYEKTDDDKAEGERTGGFRFYN